MTDFFNDQQNPFASLMGVMDAGSDDDTAAENEDMNPMLLMQQAFMMHLQMMQFMWTMPMQLMAGAMNWMSQNMPEEQPNEEKAAPEGFQLGNLNVSPELLKKVMEMDMTPENLEKLQKVLDVVFAAMPKSNKE
ncbi:MAG: hypothetical protein IKF60_05300 [Solobacterium sp.]|nr:hypothetical protein [Solobacterium sp.]